MGLKLSNRATQKQIDFLMKLDYCGSTDISSEAAGAIIDELLAERRLHRDEYEPDYYDMRDTITDV